MSVVDARLEELVAYCRAQERPMLTELEELVVHNSHTANREGATAVCGLLERSLASVPCVSVRTIASDAYAPHLVAATVRAGEDPGGCVALVGHYDTVFPPGSFEGFRVDGGLVRGPGVLDMKGGLVVMRRALLALAHVGVLEALPLRMVVVSDEEVGSPESADVIERELSRAACALVFEAGRAHDAIITRRKGTGSVRLVATGKAAHSGNAHAEGANAIWALCRAIDEAQRLTDYARGVTINTGTIAGGQGRNTVPDRAEALLDVRFVTIRDGEDAVACLRLAAARATAAIAGTRVVVEGGVARPPLERTDATVALYREYADSARAAGLGDGEAGLIGGGSDAATTGALGIPSIDGLGPRGTGFHTKNECVEIATFVPKLEALARFLYARAVAAS